MKSRKLIVLVAAIMCGLLLCAFAVIPTVRLSYGGEHNVDVSYRGAQFSKDKLTITVNYESDGEFFEIGRDIVVATDSNFNNPLRMKNCDVGDGSYAYEFNSENLDNIKTVYIKPPILYMPVEITPVSVPMVAGKVAKMSTEDVNFETAGANWFFVDTVNVEEESEGVYRVKIVVGAKAKDLPRFPKLVNGETQIGGISALHFDENDNFEYGEFLFSINASSEKEAAMIVATSSLVVSDALIRVDANDLAIASNVKSLSVVVSDSE